MAKSDIRGLFPVPFMRIQGLLDQTELDAFKAQALEDATQTNRNSEQLQHTAMVHGEHPRWRGAVEKITPYLEEFGTALFGERLDWAVKEIWANVLEPGGQQKVHAHSNSFISGVIYLTETHPSARTVFVRSLGGREFDFVNNGPNVQLNQYNADQWVSPQPKPGDAVLYPSYLLHEVPRNEGGQRMTLALNAYPNRLDSWGYGLLFSTTTSSD